LLVEQRFTDIDTTGVFTFWVVELPMNGFIVVIIVYNNIISFGVIWFVSLALID